jgi:hypothetical protein
LLQSGGNWPDSSGFFRSALPANMNNCCTSHSIGIQSRNRKWGRECGRIFAAPRLAWDAGRKIDPGDRLMNISKKLTTAAIAATMTFGALTPLASTAEARDWDRDGYSDSRGDRDRDFDRGSRLDDRRDFRRRYAHRSYRRDHRGRELAIGAFAAVLGLAIATEASRSHRYDGYHD